MRLYDCEICGGVHRWEWNGDCRQDSERFIDEQDYRERTGYRGSIELSDMTDRVAADLGVERDRVLEMCRNIALSHRVLVLDGETLRHAEREATAEEIAEHIGSLMRHAPEGP